MKKSIFTLILLAIIPCGSFAQGKEDRNAESYTIKEVVQPLMPAAPANLPDLSVYTLQNIEKLLPEKKTGAVSVVPMTQIPAFWKFTAPDILKLHQKFQNNRTPQALYIRSGVYDLPQLMQAVADKNVLLKLGNAYILRKPLYIGKEATLVIRGKPKEKIRFVLSAEDGAFMLNAGKFFAIDSAVFSWDRKTNAYTPYKNPSTFRPFLLSSNGSETYIAYSSFKNLGYEEAKSYGVSFSTDTREAGLPRPKGWIINSRFKGLYYGLYTFEADDVALIGNVYTDNIIYAIDPHDRSRRLIIAYNETYNTKVKHGIIISRGVSDSFILNNKSYNNTGSGIMLDRDSKNNVVLDNVSYNNGNYGIALFESSGNYIGGNSVIGNQKDGVRIRNSTDVILHDNSILNNAGAGILVGSANISDAKGRDFKRDPYTAKTEIQVFGGVIDLNYKENIRFEDMNALSLIGIELPLTSRNPLRGDISLSDTKLILQLLKDKRGAQINWKK